MSDYTIAADPDIAALYRAKYGHDPIVTPQSNAMSYTSPGMMQGQGNPGSLAGTGAPNNLAPASGAPDPTDALFATALQSHTRAPAPAASSDPTDAMFQAAMASHGNAPAQPSSAPNNPHPVSTATDVG